MSNSWPPRPGGDDDFTIQPRNRKIVKRIVLVLLVVALGATLTGCGKKRYGQAQCVDNFQNMVDPALCYKYQNDYGSHRNDASWLGAVPYRWAYGGTLSGTHYNGGTYGNVYDPLPNKYRAVNQSQYSSTVKKATGQTPTMLNKPITTTTMKTKSPPITSKSSNGSSSKKSTTTKKTTTHK